MYLDQEYIFREQGAAQHNGLYYRGESYLPGLSLMTRTSTGADGGGVILSRRVRSIEGRRVTNPYRSGNVFAFGTSQPFFAIESGVGGLGNALIYYHPGSLTLVPTNIRIRIEGVIYTIIIDTQESTELSDIVLLDGSSVPLAQVTSTQGVVVDDSGNSVNIPPNKNFEVVSQFGGVGEFRALRDLVPSHIIGPQGTTSQSSAGFAAWMSTPIQAFDEDHRTVSSARRNIRALDSSGNNIPFFGMEIINSDGDMNVYFSHGFRSAIPNLIVINYGEEQVTYRVSLGSQQTEIVHSGGIIDLSIQKSTATIINRDRVGMPDESFGILSQAQGTGRIEAVT